VDSLVENMLYKGLKKFIPESVTFSEFESKYKQSSQTVLPTISDDLKAGAAKAVLFGMIIICLYIFIRFRDWSLLFGNYFLIVA